MNVADQLKPVGPGRYRIEPSLRAGSLVVFCTLPGHLQAGRWAPLRIVGGEVTTTVPPS